MTLDIGKSPFIKYLQNYSLTPCKRVPALLFFLDNFPPTILSGPSELNLTVNTTISITVTAEDPNGDPMTFNVSGSLPKGAKLSTNVSSLTLTWNVTTDEVTTQN